MQNLEDSTATFFVRKLLHGTAKRRPSHNQWAPVKRSILHQIVFSSRHVSCCYYNDVLSYMYLLAFHVFLRIGEIAITIEIQGSKVLKLNQFSLTTTACTVVFRVFIHQMRLHQLMWIHVSCLPLYNCYASLPFLFMIRPQRLKRAVCHFAYGRHCHSKHLRCKLYPVI